MAVSVAVVGAAAVGWLALVDDDARAPGAVAAPAPAPTTVQPAPAVPPQPAIVPPPSAPAVAPPEATAAANWNESAGAQFDGAVLREVETAWQSERVDLRTAPRREASARDLFASVEFSEALVHVECRATLCQLALDAAALHDFERVRRLAGKVGSRAAIVERGPEMLVVLVPADTFDGAMAEREPDGVTSG
ncbi:MAG TPA: hypothetical protein VK524_00780 [Polyangiaceae bacterium]|nr:hypothetical protein [Polyangiaceae bacterium]